MLYLFDGTAIAYRAFFAFINNPLRNSEGINTSGIFGTLNTIIKILEERNPDSLAFVFDRGGKTPRHEKYPEYKATREKMPDELRSTIPLILEAVEAMGIPILQQEGVEADDILATVAGAASANGEKVVIVTGDKDIFQIIDENISILQPGRGGQSDEKLFTVENADERLGVPPEQIVDFLSLIGDSSDNIPGVKGIGKKTAQKLLGDYRTLEDIYENLDKLTKGQRSKLQDGRQDAFMSRELIRLLHIDDFADPDWKSMKRGEQDEKKLKELLTRLELQSMMKKLLDVREPEEKIVLVKEEKYLKDWLSGSPSRLGCFLLWDGPKPFEGKVVGAGLAAEGMDTIYVPVNHRREDELFDSSDNISQFVSIFAEGIDGKEIITHDDKAFMHLIRHDVNLTGTRLLSYLLAPAVSRHTLEFDLMYHLKINLAPLGDLLSSSKAPYASIDMEDAKKACGQRASAVLKLGKVLQEKLEDEDLKSLYDDIEKPLVDILYRMENRGVYIDTDVLDELSARFTEKADELEKQAYNIAEEEFNLDSPKQLREILFDKLDLPVQRRTKTGPSTDIEVLETLSHIHPMPRIIVEYRHFRKLVNTYTSVLPGLVNRDTGRIHSVLHQSVAATGRLSSSDPNLQNIPVRGEHGREIRRAFQAQKEGYVLLSADYSQIELRILAHISGDEGLKAAFESGEDIHTMTASKVFGIDVEEVNSDHRGIAKAVNYGIAYGLTPFGLSKDIDVSIGEAKKIIDDYFDKYPGVKNYMDEMVKDAEDKGYVTTLLGRRRYLPDIQGKNHNLREFAKRTAINTPIQGTSADLIKKAMIDVDKRLRDKGTEGFMILQIHDELLLEVPENEADELSLLLKETMENAMKLSVPIEVEVEFGETWADIH